MLSQNKNPDVTTQFLCVNREVGDSLRSEWSDGELPSRWWSFSPRSHDATGQLPREDGRWLRFELRGECFFETCLQNVKLHYQERTFLLQIAQIQMQNDVSMFIFLPDDVTSNMTLLEESLTAEFVQDLSMTLLPAQVTLTLPALKLSYSTDLQPLLSDLGESQRTPPVF